MAAAKKKAAKKAPPKKAPEPTEELPKGQKSRAAQAHARKLAKQAAMAHRDGAPFVQAALDDFQKEALEYLQPPHYMAPRKIDPEKRARAQRLRLEAGIAYTTDPNAPTVEMLHKEERFCAIAYQTFQRWAYEDNWAERRKAIFARWASKIEEAVGSMLVVAREKELRQLRNLENMAWAHLSDVEAKSFEGVANLLLKLYARVDLIRKDMAGELAPRAREREEQLRIAEGEVPRAFVDGRTVRRAVPAAEAASPMKAAAAPSAPPPDEAEGAEESAFSKEEVADAVRHLLAQRRNALRESRGSIIDVEAVTNGQPSASDVANAIGASGESGAPGGPGSEGPPPPVSGSGPPPPIAPGGPGTIP